jgi:lambda repressor-like predicted transcriptional regulator
MNAKVNKRRQFDHPLLRDAFNKTGPKARTRAERGNVKARELAEEEKSLEGGFTADMLKNLLPREWVKRQSAVAGQAGGDFWKKWAGELNDYISDPQYREVFRENLLGYSSILENGQYGLRLYVNAVKFVTWRVMGDTVEVAYAKALPDRWQRLVDKFGSDKDKIRNHCNAYANTKLVCELLKKTLTPSWVLNQDLYQRALNVQAELMMTARSEKVRSDAADRLMGHLKVPEAVTMQVDMKLKEDDSIKELRETTLALARAQKEAIEKGVMNAREVAERDIVMVQGERVG